jgi:Domain of unknown function (DUF1906)
MALNGQVASAVSGLIGWDTDARVMKSTAQDYYARGFRFCIRYLTRGAAKQAANDLSAAEASTILSAGLALSAVQHVALEGWEASKAKGGTYGQNAVANAQQIGLPKGMNLWLDLEGVGKASSHQDVIEYCNAWFDPVEGAGYVGGVYVGANAVLTSTELFLDLKTKHYWKSGSTVPDIPHRGYQVIQ